MAKTLLDFSHGLRLFVLSLTSQAPFLAQVSELHLSHRLSLVKSASPLLYLSHVFLLHPLVPDRPLELLISICFLEDATDNFTMCLKKLESILPLPFLSRPPDLFLSHQRSGLSLILSVKTHPSFKHLYPTVAPCYLSSGGS